MDSLTVADRGDCCPAQARALVGKGDLRLMFCYHHYQKYSIRLLAEGWEVIITDFDSLLAKTGADVH